MVLTLLIPVAAVLRARRTSSRCGTSRTWTRSCWRPGMMVGYAYAIEFFIAWYSGNPYERFAFVNRALGPYAWAYWIMVTCNVVVAAALLVQEGCARTRWMMLRGRDPGQRRHVVRALRDHRHLAAPRLPAVELGLLQADLGRRADAGRAASACSSRCSCSSSASCPMVAMAEVKSVMPQAGLEHGAAPRPRRSTGARSRTSTTRRSGGRRAMSDADEPRAARSAGQALRAAGRVRRRWTRCSPRPRRCATPASRRWDAHTPFPVHGLDEAMGIRTTQAARGWCSAAASPGPPPACCCSGG